jgi:hypothetical protein
MLSTKFSPTQRILRSWQLDQLAPGTASIVLDNSFKTLQNGLQEANAWCGSRA